LWRRRTHFDSAMNFDDPNLIQLGMRQQPLSSLTGRAPFLQLLRAEQTSLKRVWFEMNLLCNSSMIDGSHIYLRVMKEQRRFENLLVLRWRVGKNYRVWESMGSELSVLAAPVRQHYEGLNRRAEELTLIARIMCLTISRLEKHLQERSEFAFLSKRGSKRPKDLAESIEAHR
jgi:hypothetical protein